MVLVAAHQGSAAPHARAPAPAPTPSPTAPPLPPAGFVGAVGTHFVVDGKPWRFVGFNDYQLPSSDQPGAYQCGGTESDAQVEAAFAQMHRIGVTVVRTWFFQSYVAGGRWGAFDRVLHDAAANGIRVIPVLTNQWGTCEGPNDKSPYKSLDWYLGGYRMRDGYPLSYRDYALAIAARYANSSTIAFWQLINEAEALNTYNRYDCNAPAAADAIRAFGEDMTAAIKAVDHHHLVSLGTIGGDQCGTKGPLYQVINSGVDICEAHDFGPALTAPQTNPCAAQKKPFFMGERGFPADMKTGSVTPMTLEERAAAFAADMQESFAADGCQGYLIWSWSSGPSRSFDIGPGDPTDAVVAGAAQLYATPAGE